MKAKNKMACSLMVGASLMTLISCGGSSNGSSDPSPQTQQETQGNYTATLAPINETVDNNQGRGLSTITVNDDVIRIRVAMAAVPGGITHMQAIQTGGSCPTATADLNSDTFVDVIEGVPSYGAVLIPLDGELASQNAGANGSPTSSALGVYDYDREASLSAMTTDLQAVDDMPNDSVVKLPPGEALNLAGKTIVVYGISNNVTLPGTVSSVDGMPSNATLPIACGVITRVTTEDETP